MRIFPGLAVALLVVLFAGCASETGKKVDFDGVLAKAKSEGKPILLDFHATWCGPCKKMDQEVWPAKEVKAEVARFLFVSVDVDANRDLARKYRATAIPLVVVLDPDGKEKGRFVGYLPPEQVVARLRSLISG